MSKTFKPRAQLPADPGCLSAPVVLGALLLSIVLFYWAAFEGATVYGADAEDVAASGRLFYAAWCCLVGAVLLAVAFWGKDSDQLIPVAAVAFAGAAVFCATATAATDNVVLGLLCVLLGLLTPWWLLGARYRISMLVMFGVVSAALLGQRWDVMYVSALSCRPVPIEVETRISAAMKQPGDFVVDMQATRMSNVPGRWILGGGIQPYGEYQGTPDIGLWLLIENDDSPDDHLLASDAMYSVNYEAIKRTNFPRSGLSRVEVQSDRDLIQPVQDCVKQALNDKGGGE